MSSKSKQFLEGDFFMAKWNKWQCITILVGIISGIGLIGSIFTMSDKCKIYDYEPSFIVEQLEDDHYTMTSIVENMEQYKNISYFLLCGSEQLEPVSTEKETAMKITVQKKRGQVKILAQNIEEDLITTYEMDDIPNGLLLDDVGKYRLFVVGKWFTGNVEIEPI